MKAMKAMKTEKPMNTKGMKAMKAMKTEKPMNTKSKKGMKAMKAMTANAATQTDYAQLMVVTSQNSIESVDVDWGSLWPARLGPWYPDSEGWGRARWFHEDFGVPSWFVPRAFLHEV